MTGADHGFNVAKQKDYVNGKSVKTETKLPNARQAFQKIDKLAGRPRLARSAQHAEKAQKNPAIEWRGLMLASGRECGSDADGGLRLAPAAM
jgi:hypothetical protein